MGAARNKVAGQASGTSGSRWRPAVAGISLVAAAGLGVGGCGSTTSSSSTPGCFTKAAATAQAGPARQTGGARGREALDGK